MLRNRSCHGGYQIRPLPKNFTNKAMPEVAGIQAPSLNVTAPFVRCGATAHDPPIPRQEDDMNKTKQIQWWNPFAWFGAVLRSTFAFFGMMSPPPTSGLENLQVADVKDAEKVAREAQEAST